MNADNENRQGVKVCKPVLEDYMEYVFLLAPRRVSPLTLRIARCLHHNKEAAKIRTLQAAYRKREAQTPRDQARSAGEIRSLGLLHERDEDVDMKHGNLLPTLKDNRPRGEGQKPIVH